MGDGPAVRRLLAVCLEECGTLRAELPPALQLLRRGLPGVRLAILAPCGPSGGPAADSLPVDGILTFPNDRDAGALLDLVSEVRRRHFDAAVILTQTGASPYLAAYVCYLAGVPVRVGQSCEFGGGILSHRFAPQPGDGPARAQFLALAGRALGVLAPPGLPPAEAG